MSAIHPESVATTRLRDFVVAMTHLVGETDDEARLIAQGGDLLRQLVAVDDWLPEGMARPHAQFYRQYLLHADALERFSVVSFVWGPGQQTPVHDHQVWGLIGMLRGSETAQAWAPDAAGRMAAVGPLTTLLPGQVEAVSPRIGDIHRVANALADQVSISIHVYGANIGAVKRWVYPEDGSERKPFVSGYTNAWVPNLWDRSKEAATS
jgi:predicted metal-dependent enzyme (double-stranded beta helix superfamily)